MAKTSHRKTLISADLPVTFKQHNVIGKKLIFLAKI